MSFITLTESYVAPPIDEREILRYAGCKGEDAEISKLLFACLQESHNAFSYQVCYCELPLEISGNVCDFGAFHVTSKALAKNLQNSAKAIVFVASVGLGIDRLIAKYNRVSPVKALMMQAIGTERIEALCDAFTEKIKKERGDVSPRFSPGYGDLPLETQRDIFALTDASKKLGVCLNDSLLISPTKSVTAFIGLDGAGIYQNKKMQWLCAGRLRV